jgi:CBS domain-containing protein
MTIASILAEKGNTLISVAPGTSIGEVTRIMHDNQIGAVLVMENDDLLGVLSERGIVRALALHPRGVRAMRADSAMKPRQHETRLTSTLEEAMKMMTDNRVRYLPVRDGTTLIGLISVGDVVKAELRRHAYEVQHFTDYIGGAQ